MQHSHHPDEETPGEIRGIYYHSLKFSPQRREGAEEMYSQRLCGPAVFYFILYHIIQDICGSRLYPFLQRTKLHYWLIKYKYS